MNRRSMLIQTVTGAVAAVVFTSTGWLMGTRTLTMGGAENPTPPPGSGTGNQLVNCQGGSIYCTEICAFQIKCIFTQFCPSYARCMHWLIVWNGCETNPKCNVGYCSVDQSPTGDCGDCINC